MRSWTISQETYRKKGDKNMSEQMPIMRSYLAIKREIPRGTILLFRLGDFYEMFGEDAVVSAPILGIILTRRCDTPMCGFPAHSICSYLAKFIRCGKSVALAEMVESTRNGVGRYEVVRIVMPGKAESENVK